jgi:hypothetical protein
MDTFRRKISGTLSVLSRQNAAFEFQFDHLRSSGKTQPSPSGVGAFVIPPAPWNAVVFDIPPGCFHLFSFCGYSSFFGELIMPMPYSVLYDVTLLWITTFTSSTKETIFTFTRNWAPTWSPGRNEGHLLAVWAPDAEVVYVMGDFNGGTRPAMPFGRGRLRHLGASSWSRGRSTSSTCAPDTRATGRKRRILLLFMKRRRSASIVWTGLSLG